MPDIPEKFKNLYDEDKMLFLLKGKKLTKKELIEKCKENRTFGDYLFRIVHIIHGFGSG